MKLSIEMLPARQGDALWVEYGSPRRRILIDGGVEETWEPLRERVEKQPMDERHFELLVVSHIDNDHIQGVLPLLELADELGVTFGDVWFNGFRHLPDTPIESLGPVEGERLTTLLVDKGLPWNERFGGRAVVIPPGADALPRIELDGGLSLTLLSPTPTQLERLRPVWKTIVDEHNLNPAVEPEPPVPLPEGVEALGAMPDVDSLAAKPFKSDTTKPNGSSIALLLEVEDGPSALLAADAFPTVVQESVERLLAERGEARLALDAFKLPHHGSRANINHGLLGLIDCPLHLFSSDGTQTKHPHPESVARVLATSKRPLDLAFNYLTKYNEPWRDSEAAEHYGYGLQVPPAGGSGLTVTL